MITNSGDKDFQAKQEISNNNINSKITSKASTSSRSWSGLKDPRIVRVSRTFGGKDRHSKVCTIRGLRDRRVRLSVPTAIQLYDLQDRLGLNQPSKVVDWLLNAAKDEIDELPPLQIPPGTFAHFPQSMLVSHEANQIQSSFASLVDSYVKDEENQTTGSKSKYWNLNSSPLRSKCKEVAHQTAILSDDQRSNWSKRSKQQAETQEDHDHQVQNNPLTRTTLSSSASLQNNMMPFNSYYHWDPSNLSLSHLGSHGFSSQSEDIPHNYNVVSMAAPSSTPWSLPSGSQVLVCPSGTTPSQLFQPFVTTSTPQLNHFQMLGTNSSSASQNPHLNSLTPSLYSIGPTMRPVQLGVIPKLAHSDHSNNIGGAHESNRSTGSTTTSLSYAFHINDHPTQS